MQRIAESLAAGADLLTNEERALLDGRMADVAAECLAERRRQVCEEGYNLKHDEAHDVGELALAAAAYAFCAAQPPRLIAGQPLDWPVRQWILQHLWPWFSEHFKPKDRRRDLVRAVALGLAAIERLDRETIQSAEAG